MNFENRSFGYGLRSVDRDEEAERLGCPQCHRLVVRENAAGHMLPMPCPHLRFICTGTTRKRKMRYFGHWIPAAFEKLWIKKLGWNGRTSYVPDPDEDGVDHAEDRRFAKELKGWTYEGLTLVRRADPSGGCEVGAPVPVLMIGFEIDQKKVFKISKIEKNTKYALLHARKPVRTPGGFPVEHEDRTLLESAARDLAEGKRNNLGELSIVSMLFTNIEFLDRGTDIVGTDIEVALLNDIVLRTCAGPEKDYQLEQQDDLVRFLRSQGLAHPQLPQTIDAPGVKAWINETGKANEWSRFVATIARQYASLDNRKKTVVVNAHTIHHSMLLGMLLAKGESESGGYAMALNAANCIATGVWPDVRPIDERRATSAAIHDAKILLEYLG